jgi:hypothetical protein
MQNHVLRKINNKIFILFGKFSEGKEEKEVEKLFLIRIFHDSSFV